MGVKGNDCEKRAMSPIESLGLSESRLEEGSDTWTVLSGMGEEMLVCNMWKLGKFGSDRQRAIKTYK